MTIMWCFFVDFETSLLLKRVFDLFASFLSFMFNFASSDFFCRIKRLSVKKKVFILFLKLFATEKKKKFCSYGRYCESFAFHVVLSLFRKSWNHRRGLSAVSREESGLWNYLVLVILVLFGLASTWPCIASFRSGKLFPFWFHI